MNKTILIDINKNYKAASTGRPIKILSTTMPGLYPVCGYYSDPKDFKLHPNVQFFTADGQRNHSETNGGIELIEDISLDDLNLDDPVWGTELGYNRWWRGHYAGRDHNGCPMMWDDGMTSFTVQNLNHRSLWDFVVPDESIRDEEPIDDSEHGMDLAAFDRLADLCVDGPRGPRATEALIYLKTFAAKVGLVE